MAHPTWKLKKHPFSEFSDLEWVRYLEKVRGDGKERKLTKKELQERMQLLEHKNVILIHPEEVLEAGKKFISWAEDRAVISRKVVCVSLAWTKPCEAHFPFW